MTKSHLERVASESSLATRELNSMLAEVKASKKQIDELRRCIKVIHTWASVPGALVPEHVLKLTERMLKK